MVPHVTRPGAVVLSLLAVGVMARADIVLTQKHHSDSYQVMGQTVPAADQTWTISLGADAARIDQNADTSMVIDFAKSAMRVLLHKEKACIETPLLNPQDMVKAAMDGDADASDADKQAAMQMVQGMMGAMKLTVSVTETGDTRKIGNWNCRKYLVKTQVAMANTESEMWVTQDLKIDPAFYQKAMNSRLLQMAGAADAMKEWTKIKGVPVLSTTTSSIMGTKVVTTEELLSADTRALPASTFAVPAGYKVRK